MSRSRESESQQVMGALTKALKRHRRLLILTIFGVLIPVAVYNRTATPVYEASATLVFEDIESPLPENVTGKTSPQQFMLNRLEEITSASFAEDVAKALPKDVIAHIRIPAAKLGADRTAYVYEVIHKSIAAYPLRNSNLFKIHVQTNDPRLCVAIANMSTTILQRREYGIHLRGVLELRNFLDKQLEVSNAKLVASEDALRRFKQANAVTSLDQESQEVLRKLTEAEVLYNSNVADRDAAEKRLAAVNTVLASQRKDLVPALTNIASPSLEKLKTKVVDLEAQYAQLLMRGYGADHPEMIRQRREIEQTKKMLVDEAARLAEDSHVGDPIAQVERSVNESMSLQIDIAGLGAREQALGGAVAGYRDYLRRLPQKEYRLAALVRERDVNQKIYTALLERREEIRIAEAKEIPNSRVIDYAQLPVDPIAPRKGLNLILGMALALILGTGLDLLIEGSRNELESTLDFEHDLGWPVLTLVPQLGGGRSRRSLRTDPAMAAASRVELQSAPGESYLMLRTRLELLGVGTRYRTVLVTSCGPAEGKSTTLANLAAAFAAGGRSTVVVDAELRRPAMHTLFGVPRAPGLSDVLTGDANGIPTSPAKAVHAETNGSNGKPEGAANGIVPNLMVLTSGTRVKLWAMSKERMSDVLTKLKQQYDIVLVDSASPALVYDTMVLCGIVDAVVVVVDSAAYDPQRVKEIRRLLEPAGANVVGAVVTKIHPASRYGGYYSDYYGHDA